MVVYFSDDFFPRDNKEADTMTNIYNEIDWLKSAVKKDSQIGSVLGKGVVGTTMVPTTSSGLYRTPTPANAIELRVRSENAGDTAGGAGAWAVQLRYIDQEGVFTVENLTLAGTTPSATTSKKALRFQYALVVATGVQDSVNQGSHLGNIIIEDTAGNEWGRIDHNGFPHGSSQSSMLFIPEGKKMYLTYYNVTVDTSKTSDIAFIYRPEALTETAPYPAAILLSEQIGITDGKFVEFPLPVGPFEGPADFGLVGRVAQGTGTVEVAYQYVFV